MKSSQVDSNSGMSFHLINTSILSPSSSSWFLTSRTASGSQLSISSRPIDDLVRWALPRDLQWLSLVAKRGTLGESWLTQVTG